MHLHVLAECTKREVYAGDNNGEEGKRNRKRRNDTESDSKFSIESKI